MSTYARILSLLLYSRGALMEVVEDLPPTKKLAPFQIKSLTLNMTICLQFLLKLCYMYV